MAARDQVRSTQSLVHSLGECWSKPSLLALEITWRWLFGAPALLLVYYEASRILATTSNQLQGAGVSQFSLQDPMRAAVIIADAYAVLWPPVLYALLWLVPLLALGWSVASGIGRSLVLRGYDASLPKRYAALIALQLLRIIALGSTFAGWFFAIRWAANHWLSGTEPNLVLYCAMVICSSLGIFTLWALLSWIFLIAPLLVLLENRSVPDALYRSFRLGSLTNKLVEVNLVMGIIKLALIVLAMVFSATPLPFESVMQGSPLYIWWAIVTLLYLAASDFFQVARLVAFIQFWRVANAPAVSPSPTLATSK